MSAKKNSKSYPSAKKVCDLYLAHGKPIEIITKTWTDASRLRANIYNFKKAIKQELANQMIVETEDSDLGFELHEVTSPYEDIVVQLDPATKPALDSAQTVVRLSDSSVYLDNVLEVRDAATGTQLDLTANSDSPPTDHSEESSNTP